MGLYEYKGISIVGAPTSMPGPLAGVFSTWTYPGSEGVEGIFKNQCCKRLLNGFDILKPLKRSYKEVE
jgi:hypothetical protein